MLVGSVFLVFFFADCVLSKKIIDVNTVIFFFLLNFM